jgi:hypothetical protein
MKVWQGRLHSSPVGCPGGHFCSALIVFLFLSAAKMFQGLINFREKDESGEKKRHKRSGRGANLAFPTFFDIALYLRVSLQVSTCLGTKFYYWVKVLLLGQSFVTGYQVLFLDTKFCYLGTKFC